MFLNLNNRRPKHSRMLIEKNTVCAKKPNGCKHDYNKNGKMSHCSPQVKILGNSFSFGPEYILEHCFAQKQLVFVNSFSFAHTVSLTLPQNPSTSHQNSPIAVWFTQNQGKVSDVLATWQVDGGCQLLLGEISWKKCAALVVLFHQYLLDVAQLSSFSITT